MSKFSPFELSLFINGGNKKQIETVTHNLWVFVCEKISNFESEVITFDEFKAEILSRAYFLEGVFSKSKCVQRLKSINTLRRSVSDLSRSVELARMVKHWKAHSTKASRYLRYLANSMFSETDKYLKKQKFHAKNGAAFELGGLEQRQKIKLAERLAITKAMELDARHKEMDCLFFTVTCPPEMHPNPKYGKQSYDGTHIQEATRFLNQKMSASFKELSKKHISREKGDIFGFRVIEPHDDGCPHIHCLLFVRRKHLQTILEEIIKAFDYINLFTFKRRLRSDFHNKIGLLLKSLLNSSKNECKTPSTHFKLIKKDRFRHDKASPSSYLFKYMFEDYDAAIKGDIDSVAFGTATWRKFVGARSYSIIGWKGFVSAWRNFRKVPEESLLSASAAISGPVLRSKGLEIINIKQCGKLIKRLKKDVRPAHQRMLEFKRMLDENSFRWVNEEYLNKFGEKTTKKAGISLYNEKLSFRKYQQVKLSQAATRLLLLKYVFQRFEIFGSPRLKINYPRSNKPQRYNCTLTSSIVMNWAYELFTLFWNRGPPETTMHGMTETMNNYER